MTTTHTAHDVAVRLFAQLQQAWNASDGAAFGSVFADGRPGARQDHPHHLKPAPTRCARHREGG